MCPGGPRRVSSGRKLGRGRVALAIAAAREVPAMDAVSLKTVLRFGFVLAAATLFVGHFLMMEDPGRFNRLLSTVIAKFVR